MASLQAKISWERLRKRENKKKSFQRVPARYVIETSKKITKKKYHYGFYSNQNRLGKAEKE